MHQRSTASYTRHWLSGFLSLLLVSGCLPSPTKAPTGPKASGLQVAGKPVASPSAAPSEAPTGNNLVPTLPIEVKAPIISHNGGNVIQGTVMAPAKIISHNGGNIVGNNGGNIISHNGGNIISHNGGNIIGNNGSGFKISQVPLAYATVRLKDAAGNPVKDDQGNELVTKTDEKGNYKFPVDVKGRNLVVHAEVPGQKADLVALLPKEGVTAETSVSVDMASTLTLSYILELYVKGDLATFEKLPKDLESKARVQTEEAIVKGAIALPESLITEVLIATVTKAIESNSIVQSVFNEIRSLLVVAGVTAEGDGLRAVDVPGGIAGATAIDDNGNIYVFSQSKHTIWKITPDGIAHTILPFGKWGFSENVQIETVFPSTLVFDLDGSLLLADTFNHRIIRISKYGAATVIAGTGKPGFSGDGGQAIFAELHNPTGLVVDSLGNIIFSDSRNNRLRLISPSGNIATFAGTGEGGFTSGKTTASNAMFHLPIGLLIAKDNTILVADHLNNQIRVIDKSLLVSTRSLSSAIELPSTLAGTEEDFYMYTNGGYSLTRVRNGSVSKIELAGALDTIGNKIKFGLAKTLMAKSGKIIFGDGEYKLYLLQENGAKIHLFGNSFVATPNGFSIQNANGLAVNGDSVYYSDVGAHKVYALNGNGQTSHIAGNGEKKRFLAESIEPTTAPIPFPGKLTTNIYGELIIASNGDFPTVRRLDKEGKLSVVAGNGTRTETVDVDRLAINTALSYICDVVSTPDGRIYLADAISGKLYFVDATGVLRSPFDSSQYGFDYTNPTFLSLDEGGIVNFLDVKGSRIAMVTGTSIETRLALSEIRPEFPDSEKLVSMAFDGNGGLYLASGRRILRVSPEKEKLIIAGDGGRFLNGTTSDEGLFEVRSIAFNQAGDLFILERTQINRISADQLRSTQ